jgi:hypothetical protein
VSKLHAQEIAVAAAEALRNIDPYHTFTVPADCTQACIAALKNRKDDLRNPCILALGKFKISKAFPDLGGLFADKQNTLELRANALWALGQIKPAAFTVFLASQKGETEYKLRMLAAQGHGKGAPPMKTILGFLESERLDKPIKEE